MCKTAALNGSVNLFNKVAVTAFTTIIVAAIGLPTSNKILASNKDKSLFSNDEWQLLTTMISQKQESRYINHIFRNLYLLDKVNNSRKHKDGTLETFIRQTKTLTSNSKATFHIMNFWLGKLKMILDSVERRDKYARSYRFKSIAERYKERLKEIDNNPVTLDWLVEFLTLNTKKKNCSANIRFIEMYNQLKKSRDGEAFINQYVDSSYNFFLNRLKTAVKKGKMDDLEKILQTVPEIVLINDGKMAVRDFVEKNASTKLVAQMLDAIDTTVSDIVSGKTGYLRMFKELIASLFV